MGRSGIWVGECYIIDQQHEIREQLEKAVGGRRWKDMMIVYLHDFEEEQRDFARRVNSLIADTHEACLDRMYFVQELQSVVSEVVPAMSAVFLEKVMEKQERMESQLVGLQEEANKMVHESNAFLFKLMDADPSHRRIFGLDGGQSGQPSDRS
ncbi:hypothetical protein Tco_0052648 [Tanacetum coccineum]